jgi:hypothetical protein
MASRRPIRAASAVAAVVVLTLTACSGDDGDATSTSEDGTSDTAAEPTATAATGVTSDTSATGDADDGPADTTVDELLDALGNPDDPNDPDLGGGGLGAVLERLGDLDDLSGLLEGLDLGNLDIGALGALLGGGLEELIEEQAGVDIEVTDDGVSVESEDGSLTVDDDGNFTIVDADGEETTGSLDLTGDGTAGVAVEGEDGSVRVDTGEELPEEWPDDVPRPADVHVRSAMTLDQDGSEDGSDGGADGLSIVVTGSVEAAPGTWATEYGDTLEAAGFTEEASTRSGRNVNATYSDGTWKVAVIATDISDDTTVSITLGPAD